MYKNEKDGKTEVLGVLRHGADNDVKIISCGPGCNFLAISPEKDIAATRFFGWGFGGQPCPNTPGDTKDFFKCLSVRYGGYCDRLLFGTIDLSTGCDATCQKCKSHSLIPNM